MIASPSRIPLLLSVALGLLAACSSSEDSTSSVGPPGSKAGAGGKGGGAQAGSSQAGSAQGGSAQGGAGGQGGIGIGGNPSNGAPEVCGDGLDNNGNGAADEGCPCQEGATQSCFAGPPEAAGKGTCTMGMQTCHKAVSGELEVVSWGPCEGSKGPVEEVCGDDLDNDCDGKNDVDEGCGCADAEVVDCSSACGAGTMVCKDGKLSACSAPQPGAEVCDGKDNDCDGQIDEECCVEGDTLVCTTECGVGSQTCTGGKLSGCVVTEPKPDAPASCGGPSCQEGAEVPCTTACGSGKQVCTNGKLSACSAPQPKLEDCDGQDNDCDGKVDENVKPKSCQIPQTGAAGQMKCVDGAWGPCGCIDGTQQTCTDEFGSKGVIVCTNGVLGDCQCKDGTIQPCTAADGSPGKTVCSGGKYGACGCDAGTTQKCTTAGGTSGQKSCGIDGGAWTACCPSVPSGSGRCTDGAVESCDETTMRVCCGGAWGTCHPNDQIPVKGTDCIAGSVVLDCPASTASSMLTECIDGHWQCTLDDKCKPSQCDSCIKTNCQALMESTTPACQRLLDTTFDWLSHCGTDRSAYFKQLASDPACPTGVVQKFNSCKLTKCSSLKGGCNGF